MEKTAHAVNLPRIEEPRPGPPTFGSQLDEKPLFHNSRRPPGTSGPFVLSGDGDCVPYTINRYLRDYQREGVRFIYNSYVRSKGCILGDDMGLGKTIQVIAFLAAVLRKTGTWEDVENNVPQFLLSQRSSKQQHKTTKVFLVVAPLSLLYNWKDELDTWGHFRSIIVHGTRKDEEFARVQRGRCEIALTTYETLRLCMDQFNSIDWSAIIADEAHKIKNPSSQITQAMKQMKCKVRVGLTGTVLQNNLEELWCVMDWANPGYLGTLESFRSRFAEPIEQGQRHSATKRALATGREAARALARCLSRCFLRRTKALISSQLPGKDDRVVFCSLTEFQQLVYRAVLDSEDVTLLLRSGERCCGSGRPRSKCCFKKNSKGVAVKDLYFSYLAILRKVANHVALLQPREGTSKTQEQYVTEICEKVFQKFPDFIQRCKQAAFEAMSDPMYSGKMKVLQSLLKHYMQKKDKVLLFSLSTKLLDVLESYCMAAGLEYRRLDGGTRCKDRVKIVKEFNSSLDINICLVSTMAGGLGLNFVGANIVVLFDPTWNPANDLQAIDRVYRIGQCRDVTVLRLISLGTIEEVIYLRQVYKQQLESAVVGSDHARRYFEAMPGPDGLPGELFGIRNLFRLQTQGTCLTRRILEREGRLEAGILMAETAAGEHTVGNAPEGQPRKDAPQGGIDKGAPRLAAGVLDFSSASEDEDGHGARRKPPPFHREEEHGPSGRQNLLHFAFIKLHQGTAMSSGDESEEINADEGFRSPTVDPTSRGHPAHSVHRNWTISSDSEEGEMGMNQANCDRSGVAISRERDDVDLRSGMSSDLHRKSRTKRRRVNQVLTSDDSWESGSCSDSTRHTKHTDQYQIPHSDMEESDDVAVLDPSELHSTATVSVASNEGTLGVCRNLDTGRGGFTRLRKRVRKRQPGPSDRVSGIGSIDKLLGGVQEVAYTHSNQRVVGSSRAEACMSHAALRDVFQYGRNTQAPGNMLLEGSETPAGGTQASYPDPTEVGGTRQAAPGHSGPSVKHPVTQNFSTVLRGRKSTFVFGQTPVAVCRKQLREMAAYFKAPSLKDFAEDVLRSTSDRRQAMLQEFYGSQNPHLKDVLCKVFWDSAKSRPEPQGSAPEQLASPSTSRSDETKATPVSNLQDGSPVQDQPLSIPRGAVSPMNGKALILSSSSGLEPRPNVPLLSDLIGDTSILDDLFKRKTRSTKPSSLSVSPASGHTKRAKTRCKDFWDILSEGNEECINKLTDLSQVEKICNSPNVPTRTKNDEQADSSQLWRKNEKFIWKK